MHRIFTVFLLASIAASSVQAGMIFVNEIHYDNVGGDLNEFIEVAVPSSQSNLSQIEVSLYNGGSNSVYDSETLDNFVAGATNVVIGGSNFDLYTWSPGTNGIQNGGADGWAITELGVLCEFLSYEGTLTPTSGPAMGLTSTDIGVAEISAPLGTSIQLINGTWHTGLDNTFGEANPAVPEPTGQVLALFAALGCFVVRRRR